MNANRFQLLNRKSAKVLDGKCRLFCRLVKYLLGPVPVRRLAVNSLASARIRGFSEKKRLNARGFAQEFLWSGMLYRQSQKMRQVF